MLTIVMAVYGQPLMLTHQITAIIGYPEVVRKQLTVIVVDDCGEPPVSTAAIEWLAGFVASAKLFRIEKDIPWNQMGARNLGMQHAEGWCLMIDPDMVFDSLMMARLQAAAAKLTRGYVAKYGLRHVSTGKLDMSSPNTYLIHRDDFFAVGGYDEDYAGNKGWSDVQLLDVLRSCYKMDMRPDLFAHFHSNADIEDAAVMFLDRSTSANKKKRIKKTNQARKAGGWARWAKSRANVSRLRFPWKQVY